MNNQIVSEVISIQKPDNMDVATIEEILQNTYGEIIRWAIIDIVEESLKINLTFEKQV
ncbi:hypothetical protein HDR58_09715 [bacterium]|nr:hypothetical protein [bacterium]